MHVLSAGAVVAVVAIAALAAFLQRITGFGFSLLSVPLMSLAVPPTTAVVVASLCSFPNTLLTAWQLRAHVDVALVKRFGGWAYVGMPFGLVILSVVPERPFRIFLGIVVAVATALMASGVRVVTPRVWVDRAAAVVSGVLATSTSTNGPPLVLALRAHRLAPDRFRGTISAIFVTNNVALVLFWWRSLITAERLALAALAVPLVPVAATLGRRVAARLRDAHFERMVLGLLFATAAAAIYGGLRG